MSSATFWCPKIGFSFVLPVVVLLTSGPPVLALGQEPYVSSTKGPGRFALSADGKSAPLLASAEEYPGVLRVLGSFQADVARVTKVQPTLAIDRVPEARAIVLAGTLGKSPLVDR